MEITAQKLTEELYKISQNHAPVREINDKNGKPKPRGVGKEGTNMYSPYPGNLKNNGIVRTENGVVFDYDKVGYIGYANLRSKSPQFIKKTVEDFCNYCVSLGGRIIKR